MTEAKVSLSDGHNIKYVETGDGDRTVLLMPGALGTGKSDFLPQLQGERFAFLELMCGYVQWKNAWPLTTQQQGWIPSWYLCK